MLLQVVAVGYALRIYRTLGRSLAWILVSIGMVLLVLQRLLLLASLAKLGIPEELLVAELLGLLTSAALLAGIMLLLKTFRTMNLQANRVEEARARARAEADKLAALMAAAPIPILITEDRHCRFIRGNPAAAALLRMPEDANVSKSAPPGEAPMHFKVFQEGRELPPEELPMQRATREGQVTRDLPLDLVFEDGESRHIRHYSTPWRDSEGQIRGAICCMVDVTDAHRAEEALAKAQKMESLGMLAGGLAHDFNNIFQTMVANLEMAQEAVPEESRGHVYLERLKAGLERASGLSRDILHASGGDLRRPESVALAPLIAELLDRTGLPVSRELSLDLPKVMVDPVLIGRVVEGLVTNAMEASDGKGSIRVRTYARGVAAQDLGTGHWPEPVEQGLYAVLEVSDQGHGIESEMLPKIFDPFFSTRDMGRGLGLAAAVGIIRGHRGGLQVESIPGVGSVFRVYLPSPESQESFVLHAPQGPSSQNIVLLADDEDELREVLGEMLEEWFGLEVVSASDGQEALDIFAQRPDDFDLVILDATMPRMGGVEAFKAMHQIRPGLPGILCSGYAMPASREKAISEGFADFLKKPFTSAELETLLHRVMGVKMK